MKKLLTFIIIFTSISLSSNAASFNWTKHDVAIDDSIELYYDKKSIFQVGSYKYYWVLANFLKEVQDNNLSMIGHHMANCETNEMKMITMVTYDRPMGRGNVNYDYISPEEDPDGFVWEYYDPNVMYGDMIKKICKIR